MLPPRTPNARIARLTLLTMALTGGGLPFSLAQRPARLLASDDDFARIRHAAGIASTLRGGESAETFGRQSRRIAWLRHYFSSRPDSLAAPGEVAAAAFLHRVAPGDPDAPRRLALVAQGLAQPPGLGPDEFEVALALDWCWDVLDRDVRDAALRRIAVAARPLGVADSPSDPHAFGTNLVAGLVASLVDDEHGDDAWRAFRRAVLPPALHYLQSPFRNYVAWRGGVPTSPSTSAAEEWDAALAIETLSLLERRDAWSDYRASVGRWLEHYLLVESGAADSARQFAHDAAGTAYLAPHDACRGAELLTAHLIARRTGDPAAVTRARALEAYMDRPDANPNVALWQWVAIALEIGDMPGADASRLPLARNLDGAFVLRGVGADGARFWIDSARTYLSARQHFDVGSFLARAGGELVVEGGDDVLLEVVQSKGGSEHVGARQIPGVIEQFHASTIAHNGVLLWDATRVSEWNGRPFLPAGGQRCIDGGCRNYTLDPSRQGREVCRVLAYGQTERAAYVALDLSPAYDPRTVTSFTREFVFVTPGALVVIDRIAAAHPRAIPTWILNLPARPTASAKELAPDQQVLGDDPQAGAWRLDAAERTIEWRESSGHATLLRVEPQDATWGVVGGPAEPIAIASGPHAGRTYVGGSAESFERRVLPIGRPDSENAWYRHGRPTLLGPHVGATPHWGRVEIEPRQLAQQYTFIHVVTVGSNGDDVSAPVVGTEGDETLLEWPASAVRPVGVRLTIARGPTRGGVLRLSDPPSDEWRLPDVVHADAPLITTVDDR